MADMADMAGMAGMGKPLRVVGIEATAVSRSQRHITDHVFSESNDSSTWYVRRFIVGIIDSTVVRRA